MIKDFAGRQLQLRQVPTPKSATSELKLPTYGVKFKKFEFQRAESIE
jgi:hypothetical protein